jgi:hypothetical protein
MGVAGSTDDALLQVMLDSATTRIDSHCQRQFVAPSDTVRYFDPSRDVLNGELWLDEDLSYITSVVNGDSGTTNVTASVYTEPRNSTPFYKLGFKTSAAYTWEYTTDSQNAISVTGRWAYMSKAAITAISRTSNVVTATVAAPDVSVGSTVYITGVADTGFNGSFTVVSNTGTTITWAQTASNDTDTTGTMLFAPIDIVQACRRLAAWMYRQKDTQQGDIDRPILAGDGSVIMPTTLPQDVATILKPYMRQL